MSWIAIAVFMLFFGPLALFLIAGQVGIVDKLREISKQLERQ